MSSRSLVEHANADPDITGSGSARGRGESAATSSVKSFFTRHVLWVALLALVVIVSTISPTFRTMTNLQNVLMQSSILGVVALGMLVMMVSGGFDMSIGSAGGLLAVLAAMVSGVLNIWMGLLVALVVGLVVGAINGLIISRLRIHSFIATLATGSVILGLVLVGTNSRPTLADLGSLSGLAFGRFLGIPLLFWIFAVFAVITSLFLKRTKWGHWIFATGGNRNASYLSGIPVKTMTVVAFAFGGLSAAVGAMMLLAQSGVGQPLAAASWPLGAIAICVIGGTSLNGGVGRVSNVVAATLLLGTVSNALNQIGVSTQWQEVVTGLIILVAIVIAQSGHRTE